MKKQKEDLPIIWSNREFYAIEKFDCHVVDLKTTPNGGGYCTVIPISDLDYRKKNPTKASVSVKQLKNGYTEFLIRSDWGQEYQMLIPTIQKGKIDFAINLAKEMQLLL